ncbi:MAG: amino acid ABC transporter permease [Lactobacillus sp.]|jgi:putative glutamine transport system permease protein|uniref:Amino acid ABC transporter permease n=1 Tax=Lacticaseibacillus suilingensis TaxID=2799577 RepID=A0ABW4BFH0_9LACO|nr:amino acid ABC transporter permease [Lacticaseibacillus suilingensis]MCI1893237.1 amino acid ABC transporter permease [Lactobacillus sp.]MCI1917397.1 amino acid ABC transporter permease [Lactobacillus sp.]MCI1940813.1 amino acid ABC transporter permease [Lactobacillus sp.]MCI1971192.1 amino acid ABC transporter permease [Lactobacillus sp.]MCI2016425.1 amino acid ABC transporter permease [Lactobacillus sp.]
MFKIMFSNWDALLSGLGYTLLASVIALIASLIIGTAFALMEISLHKWVRVIGKAYVEFIRNIPLLVIAMAFYVIVPQFIMQMDGFTAGTIGLTIYTSAFIAETVRAGIQSVPNGQMEGARSNGLSYMQAMTHVVFPQAIKLVIPPLGNQFINLVKNSSVLAFVAGFDLMYQGKLIANATFNTFDTYLAVGVLYLVITMPMSYAMRYLEKRWHTA